MKRINLSVLVLLLASLVASAQNKGINFTEGMSWAQVKEKAKQENKHIFLDFYATWCGPCKYMDENVYTDKKVGDFFNEKFISVKVQMDSTSGDDENTKNWYADARKLGREYNIVAFPTMIFLSPTAELLHRAEGARMEGKDFLVDGNNALDPDKQYYTLLKQYEKGNKNQAFLKSFATAASSVGQRETALKAAREYINGLKDAELYTKENIEFMSMYTKTSKDRGFILFRKDPKKINGIAGANTAERKITEVIGAEEIAPYTKEGGPKPDWKAIEKKVISKYGELGKEAVWGRRLLYAWSEKDWEGVAKYYPLYFDRAVTRSIIHINNISWEVFENISDKNVLESAVKAMKYNLEVFDKENANSYDTYANLLYKTGKKDEAIKWEEKAVKLDPNSKSLAETLEKMKKGEQTWPVK